MRTDEIETLEEILQKEISCYRQLLALSQRKSEVLARREVRQLEEISKEETGLISKVVDLEQERLETMQVMASELRVPLGELTLWELSQRVNEPYAQRLKGLHREIVDLLDELRRLNTLNNNLIEKELAFLNYSLDLLTNPHPQSVVYPDPTKEEKEGGFPSFFDIKA